MQPVAEAATEAVAGVQPVAEAATEAVAGVQPVAEAKIQIADARVGGQKRDTMACAKAKSKAKGKSTARGKNKAKIGNGKSKAKDEKGEHATEDVKPRVRFYGKRAMDAESMREAAPTAEMTAEAAEATTAEPKKKRRAKMTADREIIKPVFMIQRSACDGRVAESYILDSAEKPTSRWIASLSAVMCVTYLEGIEILKSKIDADEIKTKHAAKSWATSFTKAEA